MENSEKWSDNDVQDLLALYAAEEVQSDLEGCTRNLSIFGKIAGELAQIGVHHTAKQCREKIKKLKQDYKKIKDHNNRSGANRRTSKWYATLDGILGHRPAYSGNAATQDGAGGFMEVILGDTENSPAEESHEELETSGFRLEQETVSPVDPSSSSSISSQRVPHVGSGTPRRPPPAKRRTTDSSILSVVRNVMESDAEQRRRRRRRRVDGMENSEKWSDNDVQDLLALYATEEVQSDLEGCTRNLSIFGKIAGELAQIGVHHTAKQCREKIKKLKQDYKRIKDHNNRSGANRRTSKWYATLDGILGHRPAYSGNAATQDGAGGFMEVILGDTENSPAEESHEELETSGFLLEQEPVSPVDPSSSSSISSQPSTSQRVPHVGSGTPRRPPPAKRRRTASSILSVVRNMMESDAEQRRVSDARFVELIDLMREQTKADAEERAAANARDREFQSFQTRWMDSLLSIAARMAPRQEDQ